MRDAIGLVRWLDKEFAHAPDKMSLRVIRFGTHQLRRINLHRTTSFLTTDPGFPGPTNKKPAHRKGRPRGKHLIQMDLPLAWSGPSPPDRVRHLIHPAPYPARNSCLHSSPAAFQSTRPRLHFTPKHAHLQNF